jgi:hypothetical protein
MVVGQSRYTAEETLEFAAAPGLLAKFTPVRGPEDLDRLSLLHAHF